MIHFLERLRSRGDGEDADATFVRVERGATIAEGNDWDRWCRIGRLLDDRVGDDWTQRVFALPVGREWGTALPRLALEALLTQLRPLDPDYDSGAAPVTIEDLLGEAQNRLHNAGAENRTLALVIDTPDEAVDWDPRRLVDAACDAGMVVVIGQAPPPPEAEALELVAAALAPVPVEVVAAMLEHEPTLSGQALSCDDGHLKFASPAMARLLRSDGEAQRAAHRRFLRACEMDLSRPTTTEAARRYWTASRAGHLMLAEAPLEELVDLMSPRWQSFHEALPGGSLAWAYDVGVVLHRAREVLAVGDAAVAPIALEACVVHASLATAVRENTKILADGSELMALLAGWQQCRDDPDDGGLSVLVARVSSLVGVEPPAGGFDRGPRRTMTDEAQRRRLEHVQATEGLGRAEGLADLAFDLEMVAPEEAARLAALAVEHAATATVDDLAAYRLARVGPLLGRAHAALALSWLVGALSAVSPRQEIFCSPERHDLRLAGPLLRTLGGNEMIEQSAEAVVRAALRFST